MEIISAKCCGQSGSSRLHAQPIALLRAQDVIVRERVGAKSDFVGKGFEPLFNGVLELRRIHTIP